MENNMMPPRTLYTVYVQTDDRNRITAVNSSAFLNDLTGWTEIDSGDDVRFMYARGNYFNPPIMDTRCVWRYKLVDGKPVERTQEEMDADYAARPAPPPSDKERIAALEAQLAAYEVAYAEGVNEA